MGCPLIRILSLTWTRWGELGDKVQVLFNVLVRRNDDSKVHWSKHPWYSCTGASNHKWYVSKKTWSKLLNFSLNFKVIVKIPSITSVVISCVPLCWLHLQRLKLMLFKYFCIVLNVNRLLEKTTEYWWVQSPTVQNPNRCDHILLFGGWNHVAEVCQQFLDEEGSDGVNWQPSTCGTATIAAFSTITSHQRQPWTCHHTEVTDRTRPDRTGPDRTDTRTHAGQPVNSSVPGNFGSSNLVGSWFGFPMTSFALFKQDDINISIMQYWLRVVRECVFIFGLHLNDKANTLRWFTDQWSLQ